MNRNYILEYSNINIKNIRYSDLKPINVANKIANRLFSNTKLNKLYYCIRETTLNSKKNKYYYIAIRDNNKITVKSNNKNKKKGGLDYHKIFEKKLTFLELFEIFYDNFENLDILLDKLKIENFQLRKYNIKEDFCPGLSDEYISDTNIICIRAVFFSYGSFILLKKYGGFFSNMFLFMYFYVQYFKEHYPNNREIYKNYKPDNNCILYLLKYMPLNGLIDINNKLKLYWFDNEIYLNNTICEHITTGGSTVPHFFISSASTKDILEIPHGIKMYLKRTKDFINQSQLILKKYNINNLFIPIPIFILLRPSIKNKVVKNTVEDDHIFAPFVSKDSILSINDENGNKLNMSYLSKYFSTSI